MMDNRVTSTYMFPYKEDLLRFDFEVDQEDEYMCRAIGDGIMTGFMTAPAENGGSEREEQHE